MRLGPSSLDDTMQRLPGLTVTIGETCSGCGICHEKCPVGAIHFEAGISVIDQARCKGCGLWAAACPQEAPKLVMDERVDMVAQLTKRIRARTEVGI
jgi:heterodisulfide reductase subunit A-like polyferredoxin